MFDHSQSLFWVGDIARQRGETDAAREAFSGYHALAKRLVALEPDNDDWQLELKYAISNLGTLARESGETEEAEDQFRQAVSLSQALLEKAPEDVERRLSAGTARAWLADTLVDQLLLQQASEQRRQELEVYAAGLALHPEDTRLLLQEATAHGAAGSLAVHLGDLDAALVEVTTAVAIQERLSGLDSDSAERTEFTALARSLLGEVLFYLGEFSESETALTRAISDGETLLRGDPDQVIWRRELDARPSWILARLAYQNSPSDVGRAVSLATSALETMSSLRQSSPNDANVRRAFGLALQAAIEIGAQPTTRWSEIQALFDEQDSRAEHLLLLARARLEAGQPEKAIGPIRRLQAAGYAHPDFRALLARYPQADAARHESVDPTATPPATRSIP
jgi:tetratricopeptide (TPR) repeat protein